MTRIEDGPSRPAAPAGEVHVWRVELVASGPSSPGALTATARRALRVILSRYLGEDPETIELALGEHGKPELAGSEPRIEFNLSHSGGLALIAVASHPVGIDVEWVGRERNFLALAERELDPDVVAALSAASPDERAAIFYAAWTRHEARLKCHGGGLSGPRPAEPIAITNLAVGAEHAAALAAPGKTPPASRLYRLDLR